MTYVQPFPATGTKFEIVRAGRPMWSPKGDELFLVPAPSQFIAVPLRTEPTFGLKPPVRVLRRFGLAPPGNPRPYDILPDVQDKFVAEMKERFDFEITGVREPRQAVVESDLVVSSGPILKHPTPTIERDWLKPGAYGSAVDFDSYWTAESLAQMDRISTDDHTQFQYYKSVGYFQQTPDPYADLGELVAGLKPGRQDDKERTLAINLGLAMDDMAVAPTIYQKAKEMGLGIELPL
jgi:hypothetical protein